MTPSSGTPENITDWISGRRSRPRAKVRLACFPHAGGGASSFYSWRDVMPEWVEVLPIQLPGREERVAEAPVDDFPTLISAVHREIGPVLEPPFALFGHSLGALLAFELARSFSEAGNRLPLVLFVSSHRAPHLRSQRKDIHKLGTPSLVRALRRLGTIPSEVLDHPELRDLLLPALRADFRCFETYRYLPGPPLPVPIVATGGASDTLVTASAITPWKEHSSALTTVRFFPGDHFYLNENREEVVEMIWRTVKIRLDTE